MRMGAREIFWGGAGRQTDLPYDSEVEFLESDGDQWIDTGVFASSSIGIDFSWKYKLAGTSGLSRWSPFLGGDNGWPSGNGIGLHGTANNVKIGNGVGYYTFTVGTTYRAILSAGVWTINGTTAFTNTQSYSTQVPIYVFANNRPGAVQTSRIQVFKLQIYENGILVRDYIPVRKGTVGALYDRRGVGGMDPDGSPRNDGMYYNVGTGAFQYGQDVVPVEYIESHGTEWINLGWTPSYRDTVNIEFSVLNIKSEFAVVFGGNCAEHSSGDWFQCGCAPGSYTFFSQGGSWNYTKVGDVFKAEGHANISINTSNKCFLFAQGADNTPEWYRRSCRIWTFSVSHYGESDPYMRVIPVRVGSEGAVMDTLTRIVYRNKGSGAFGVGPDVTPHGRLPAGYTEVQWLSTQAYGTSSSGGGAYTTVPAPQAIAQSQVKVEAHAVDTDTTGTIGVWNILVDTLTGDNIPNYGMNIRRRGTEYVMCAVPGYDSYSISYTRGVPMCVVWDRGTFSVEQNGKVSSRTITAKTTAVSNAFNIGGAAWPTSGYGNRCWPGLIGEITVSVSDVEVVHLVPCRAPSGVYGFYDLVGNGFYSSLTEIPFAKGSLS